MKVKVTISNGKGNKRKNLAYVEVIEGNWKGVELPMWLGETNKDWTGKILEVGEIIEVSNVLNDELEEKYVQYKCSS